ncbi:putative thioredoxin or thiol-disulfide isomerase [Vagococcus lutrae]|uniref:thioredoxin family protein n=1 Tax=Vagococcus lutrae TaxID=81947 RepID=UPI001926444A|nr:thioredoxin family protein [Vagococcus lutrae]GEQ61706.1 putative thioredoxin or thiol-disulfide isomerase [Vagococcus lutrae]GEQ63668.1 putative thioredoxin or thiol-disulfide isomerase [Vagococcus lutrae]GEQ65559.1 putative thioredoxin or thiol-disulfide isomerase [Vagococcus lutrae]
MELLKDIETVKQHIAEEKLSLLYIGQENCSVCHGLKPQIQKIMSEFPDVYTMEVDAMDVPEVAGEFQVLTVPVVLLFVEGKEYLRKARIIQTAQFKSEVEKIVTGYLSIAE